MGANYKPKSKKDLRNSKLNIQIIKDVVQMISGYDLLDKGHSIEYSYNRFIVFKLCKELLPPEEASLSDIARFMFVTHATVLNGLNRFEDPKVFDILKENYFKAKTVLNVIFNIDLDFNFYANAPKKHNDLKNRGSEIVERIKSMVSDYENRMNFYTHNFVKDYPNIYRIFNEMNAEDLVKFEEQKAKPFFLMNGKKNIKS